MMLAGVMLKTEVNVVLGQSWKVKMALVRAAHKAGQDSRGGKLRVPWWEELHASAGVMGIIGHCSATSSQCPCRLLCTVDVQ